MKRKSGFTLAEVLITLAIIGVVAAITLPNLVTSYQYTALGVKLSKFMASLEASARAYAVANTTIVNSAESIADYADSSFAFKDEDSVESTQINNASNTVSTANDLELKDGTRVSFALAGENDQDEETYPLRKYGAASAVVTFQPVVAGLPSTVHQAYRFTVTELGFAYPNPQDACNVALYKDLDYRTKSSDFKANKLAASCVEENAQGGGDGNNGGDANGGNDGNG